MKSIFCVSFLLVSSVSSFVTQHMLQRSIESSIIWGSSTRLNMYSSVEEAIAEAKRICAINPGSQECAVAWDIVEELEAADSHKNNGIMNNDGPRNMSPDLVALLYSFDILVQKIDGKMDHLIATAEKLQELGADDPAVGELGIRAEEMKNILAYVNNQLRQQV